MTKQAICSAAMWTAEASKRARELMDEMDARVPNEYRTAAFHRARCELMRAASHYQDASDGLLERVRPRDYEEVA